MDQGKGDHTAASVATRRQEKGQRAYLSGQAAEAGVIRAYAARGVAVLHSRWRGQGGEIDLILRDADDYVFCEVKKAATVDLAMARLRPAQARRIVEAAAQYLGQTPEGQLASVRFDLAAVDGSGAVEIVENAFGHF
ncbi:putative endonuclease [Roseovarius marisflavi]|uniref:Putative endonuclease n=1 Tax=Roseovarius marisflavi TaxID=1054996 RepID=A0A1M7BIJ8_9RHOB|nr:YraN family protein [Roseovarius marisflavi]SHL54822.1 putative endonuclease [Roseovarius marisflavi]